MPDPPRSHCLLWGRFWAPTPGSVSPAPAPAPCIKQSQLSYPPEISRVKSSPGTSCVFLPNSLRGGHAQAGPRVSSDPLRGSQAALNAIPHTHAGFAPAQALTLLAG